MGGLTYASREGNMNMKPYQTTHTYKLFETEAGGYQAKFRASALFEHMIRRNPMLQDYARVLVYKTMCKSTKITIEMFLTLTDRLPLVQTF